MLPDPHPSGQAGECAGCVPPADGAVPGAASPRPQDRLPAEAATGGSGHHQGPNIPALHGMSVCVVSRDSVAASVCNT